MTSILRGYYPTKRLVATVGEPLLANRYLGEIVIAQELIKVVSISKESSAKAAANAVAEAENGSQSEMG